jgi:hypothetical protein
MEMTFEEFSANNKKALSDTWGMTPKTFKTAEWFVSLMDTIGDMARHIRSVKFGEMNDKGKESEHTKMYIEWVGEDLAGLFIQLDLLAQRLGTSSGELLELHAADWWKRGGE